MPTNTYTAIATITLASTDSEIVFSSIPATYRDLIVVLTYPTAVGNANATIFFNSDFGNNYSRNGMGGNGSSTFVFTNGTAGVGFIFANQANQVSIIQVMDYSATDKHKTLLARADSPASETLAVAGRWANTAAITSLHLTAQGLNYPIGTKASLYGIAG